MSARFGDQFVFDEVSLLMLNETEQLTENHRANDTVESRREIGRHPLNGRHGLGRNSFVFDVIHLVLLVLLFRGRVFLIHDDDRRYFL